MTCFKSETSSNSRTIIILDSEMQLLKVTHWHNMWPSQIHLHHILGEMCFPKSSMVHVKCFRVNFPPTVWCQSFQIQKCNSLIHYTMAQRCHIVKCIHTISITTRNNLIFVMQTNEETSGLYFFVEFTRVQHHSTVFTKGNVRFIVSSVRPKTGTPHMFWS